MIVKRTGPLLMRDNRGDDVVVRDEAKMMLLTLGNMNIMYTRSYVPSSDLPLPWLGLANTKFRTITALAPLVLRPSPCSVDTRKACNTQCCAPTTGQVIGFGGDDSSDEDCRAGKGVEN